MKKVNKVTIVTVSKEDWDKYTGFEGKTNNDIWMTWQQLEPYSNVDFNMLLNIYDLEAKNMLLSGDIDFIVLQLDTKVIFV